MVNDMNKKSIGLRIKNIRESLGLSMEEFGRKLSTSKGAVNNWEKGKNLPNVKRLNEIAQLGNMTRNELVYGSVNDVVNELIKFSDYILYKLRDEGVSSKELKKQYGNQIDEVKFLKILNIANFIGSSFTDRISRPPEFKIKEDDRDEKDWRQIDLYFHRQHQAILDILTHNTIEEAKKRNISSDKNDVLLDLLFKEAESLFTEETKDNFGFITFVENQIADLDENKIVDFLYYEVENKDGSITSVRRNSIDTELEEAVEGILEETLLKLDKLRDIF